MSKDQYREYFKKVQKYIKLTQILENLDFPRTKFSTFLSGDDNSISLKRLEMIKNEVESVLCEIGEY